MILSWFVDVEVGNSAVTGNKTEENDIEVRPEKISVSYLDESVCLESCRKYCSQVTWSALMGVVDILKKNPIWYCERCTNPIHDESQVSVVCDCCINWHHFWCLDMKNQLNYGFAGSDYLSCINSNLNDECCFYDNDNNET